MQFLTLFHFLQIHDLQEKFIGEEQLLFTTFVHLLQVVL